MQIHNGRRLHKRKKEKNVGRGGIRGTYSGRGIKGQKAHGSHGIRPELRDIIKKIHKRRGYKFTPVSEKPAVVSLSAIDREFFDGATVSPKTLFEKKLVSRRGNKMPRVKVLATGDIERKVSVSGCIVSRSAREKILKAGGSVA